MSGWVFHRGVPRDDPIPRRHLERLAERRRVTDVHVPVALNWALLGDVFFVHCDDGATTATRIRYVDRGRRVECIATPVDIHAPAGLTWRTADASATSDTSLLEGVPVTRE